MIENGQTYNITIGTKSRERVYVVSKDDNEVYVYDENGVEHIGEQYALPRDNNHSIGPTDNEFPAAQGFYIGTYGGFGAPVIDPNTGQAEFVYVAPFSGKVSFYKIVNGNVVLTNVITLANLLWGNAINNNMGFFPCVFEGGYTYTPAISVCKLSTGEYLLMTLRAANDLSDGQAGNRLTPFVIRLSADLTTATRDDAKVYRDVAADNHDTAVSLTGQIGNAAQRYDKTPLQSSNSIGFNDRMLSMSQIGLFGGAPFGLITRTNTWEGPSDAFSDNPATYTTVEQPFSRYKGVGAITKADGISLSIAVPFISPFLHDGATTKTVTFKTVGVAVAPSNSSLPQALYGNVAIPAGADAISLADANNAFGAFDGKRKYVVGYMNGRVRLFTTNDNLTSHATDSNTSTPAVNSALTMRAGSKWKNIATLPDGITDALYCGAGSQTNQSVSVDVKARVIAGQHEKTERVESVQSNFQRQTGTYRPARQTFTMIINANKIPELGRRFSFRHGGITYRSISYRRVSQSECQITVYPDYETTIG